VTPGPSAPGGGGPPGHRPDTAATISGTITTPKNAASRRNPLHPLVQKTYQKKEKGRNTPTRKPNSWQGARPRRRASLKSQRKNIQPTQISVAWLADAEAAVPPATRAAWTTDRTPVRAISGR